MNRLFLMLLLAAFPVSAQLVSKTMLTNAANARIALSNHLWVAANGGTARNLGVSNSIIVTNVAKDAKIGANTNNPQAQLHVHGDALINAGDVTVQNGSLTAANGSLSASFFTATTTINAGGLVTAGSYAVASDGLVFYDTSPDQLILSNLFHLTSIRLGASVIVPTVSPALHITYDLGTASAYWRTGYIASLNTTSLVVNGSMVVDSLVTPLLVVTSNVNEFAAGAYHGIDLNGGSEFVGTNSLAGNTILSYTNFYKWTNNAFSVRLEGAAAGGSDHIVTNIFAGAIGSVPTLVQVNGGANTVSPLVLTTTNGTTLEMNGKVFFSRGTNFIDLLVKWGTR